MSGNKECRLRSIATYIWTVSCWIDDILEELTTLLSTMAK